MSKYAIRAENLGKRYFLGEGTGRNYLQQALKSLMPNAPATNLQEFWALRGASFDIKKGEAIGVIGRNGAGKSTLLKMLSRVSAPSEGRIHLQGRVGTLLEVGTGFHPELTGRDNIFLSGTILGMGYREVARKFDEIVAFSEIEKFIDTPVKRYSSGMYVRLAFAVASFLEPEILIVDEVLAVGDASFQRKSLGRLNEVSEKDGRSVLFVSHNLSAIRTFCKRVLILEKGRLVFDGNTNEGLEFYMRNASNVLDVGKTAIKDRLNRANGAVRFTKVTPVNSSGETTWRFRQDEDIKILFEYEVMQAVPDMAFILGLRTALENQTVSVIRETVSDQPMQPGQTGAIEITLLKIPLRPTELAVRADLMRADDSVGYDVLDSNVDMPYLVVTSEKTDKYALQGVVSLDYRLSSKLEIRCDFVRIG